MTIWKTINPMPPNEMGNEFSMLHEKGALRWGGLWLRVNIILVNNVNNLLDVTTPEVKLALSRAAYAICDEFSPVCESGVKFEISPRPSEESDAD